MDLTDPRERERWRGRLSELFTGRKVVCGLAPLAAMTDLVRLLADAGAQKPLLVHSGRGAGPVPTTEEAHQVMVEVGTFATMTEDLRAHDRLLRDLPPDIRAAVDAYDPEREAIWLTGPFNSTDPVDGRAVVGGRPRAWAALEDKIVADDIWDAVGFPRSERRVVRVSSPDELEEASRSLDLGNGVVWVGDARDGFNGGGEFTRWVVTAEDRAEALEFFGPRCDRLRVMPFLEGVPCSIHGIVMTDGTAAFRPVELAILRGEARRFVFGGQGTSWDPPDQDREEMQALVRATGTLLSRWVGYRGAFGIDGVLTAEGFRPTELNPRFSAGLVTQARALDLQLFQLLQFNLTAGRDPGHTAAELESWAVPALDAARMVLPKAVVDRRLVEESTEIPVSWDGERLDRDPDGSLRLVMGPIAMGTFAKLDVPHVPDVGARVGPLNAAMMRFLDEEFGTGIGPVAPAPDVRRSQPRRDRDAAPVITSPQT